MGGAPALKVGAGACGGVAAGVRKGGVGGVARGTRTVDVGQQGSGAGEGHRREHSASAQQPSHSTSGTSNTPAGRLPICGRTYHSDDAATSFPQLRAMLTTTTPNTTLKTLIFPKH